MERLCRLFSCLVICFVSCMTATKAGAQGADGGYQSPFGEVIDVRVVNLEVAVTDQGTHVSGLGPQDFVLSVDGKEVEIDYFTEVRASVAQGDENASAMVPALTPGKPVETSYLLFIDEFFSVKQRRDQVLRGILDQLAGLQPGDRMAVVAYDGRKFEVLSPWKSSASDVEQVLISAMDRPANGLRERAAERSFLSSARTGGDPGGGTRRAPEDGLSAVEVNQRRVMNRASRRQDLTIEEQQQVSWLTERLERVVTAATAALRGFSDVPGRKVMLLMSGGWPDNPTDWLLRNDVRRLYQVQSDRGDSRGAIYGPLIETANLLGYSLYPIDVPGSSDAATGVTLQRATLRHLADQTGGRPMLADHSVRALARTAEDTRSYYWIGFVPQWKGDDTSHDIRIKVRRKGLTTRARRNFSDLSRERKVTMTVESLLRLGNQGSAATFPIRVGEIRKAGAGKVEVLLQMLVPVSEFTFLPYKKRHVAEAEMRIAVEDEEGTTTDIPVVPMKFTLDAPPEKGKMQRWENRIKIRRQKHLVVVTFYDKGSGKLLFAYLEVDPKSF